ncbi:hypothetical protein C8R47DRAFT_1041832 [Mycena vitilis]|nr:hypothetical protein C8R47DRAFT_1041832 [Mycena vitilis]
MEPELTGLAMEAQLDLEPKRVIDLWFEDGNIVVQAEDYQFCLLKSFLTRKSSVFQDTFSIPQPEESERINGCPVVRIYDSAVDAVHFFSALFDPETFLPPPAPTTFEKVAAVLRLSTKYDVEYLRKRALTHLSSAYPTSLAQWREGALPLATFPVLRSDALATINLAREVDCRWVLPTAFYDYCKFTGPAEIFRGTTQDGLLLSLPAPDTPLCLEARETQREASKDLEHFLTAPLEKCVPNPSPSANGKEQGCLGSRFVWLRYLQRLRQDGVWLDPTEPWEHWDHFADHVCAPCLLSCQKKYEDARQAVWLSIPGMFNLPGWTELEAERSKALELA